jgi:endonuclease/exonuclease/phosphatase family metal-dependent hydrolase
MDRARRRARSALPPLLAAAALAAVALAAGCQAPERPRGPAPPARITVVSFNIRNGNAFDGSNGWKKRREMVFDVLREQDADFVGIQEALNSQINQLRDEFPEYRHRGKKRFKLPMPVLNEATPIFYRHERWALDKKDQGTFWLSDSPGSSGSKDWGNFLPRIVTWARFVEKDTGAAVYVFNTHFDNSSERSRRKSAELLAERIAERKHPDPVIVTGDFNAGESSEPIRYLKGEVDGSPVRLVDTYRVAHPRRRNVGTFNGWDGKTTGPKIDYILVEPETDVRSARILRFNRDGRYPSDHFPVAAEVVVPGRDG